MDSPNDVLTCSPSIYLPFLPLPLHFCSVEFRALHCLSLAFYFSILPFHSIPAFFSNPLRLLSVHFCVLPFPSVLLPVPFRACAVSFTCLTVSCFFGSTSFQFILHLLAFPLQFSSLPLLPVFPSSKMPICVFPCHSFPPLRHILRKLP